MFSNHLSRPLTFLTIASIGGVSILNANTIVDFDNAPSVASQVSARSADSESDNGDTWNFSDTVALIDGSASEGTERSNLRIYGGVTTSWTNAQSYDPRLRIVNFNDFVQVQVSASSSDNSFEGMLIWNKADFLNGNDSETLTFSVSDSLSYDKVAGSATVRFVVNDGGTYYASESVDSSASAVVTLNDPGNSNWASISTADYTIGSTFSTQSFTDIQGVGLYFNRTASGAQALFNLRDFSATATISAIPEPSTYGLLAGAIGLIAIISRRRRA